MHPNQIGPESAEGFPMIDGFQPAMDVGVPFVPKVEYLTEDEHRAVQLLGEAAELIHRIVGKGPQSSYDWDELALHIHVVQRTILAQAAARAYPERYRLLGETLG